MRPVPRETSVVAFPSSNPLPSIDELPPVLADDPGAPEPVSTPSEQPAPQGTHCPAGYCPRCWEGGSAQVLAIIPEDSGEPRELLKCPGCGWLGGVRWPSAPAEVPAPPAFQTLLLPNRVPGVDPMAHVAFWAGQPYEVLAIASPETVSCGSLALPLGARVFFLRELPR